MTNCDFNLYEPEELMNQEFDQSDCVLYLIMKVRWIPQVPTSLEWLWAIHLEHQGAH